MDKLGLLINNLQDLYKNGASEEHLVGVSLEILSELTTPRTNVAKTEKVSVIMPSFYVEHHEEAEKPLAIIMEEPETALIAEEEPPVVMEMVEEELVLEPVAIVVKNQPSEADIQKFEATLLFIKEAEELHIAKYKVIEEAPKKQEATILPFTTTIRNVVTEFNEHHEIKEVFELKDILGAEEETINDRLKEEHSEINHSIKLEPVKDIKRAFNINEKYVFINELFRGDDAMFERSLKTINAFQIYPEAQYWIQRELKVKLGWNENSTTVQHFDTLVKRRFAS